MSNYFKIFKTSQLSIALLLLGAFSLFACQTPTAQVNESDTLNTPIATTAITPQPAPTETLIPVPTQTMPATATQALQEGLPATGSEATLNVADHPELGKILVDGNGMTLYMYTEDGPNQSNCSGACLDAWPPLLTQGDPTLGEEVIASMVGTAKMADDSMILTYNKMPLYTWYRDTKPGDATGQANKDVWYVVSPDGKAIGLPKATEADDYSDDYSYDESGDY